MIKDQKWVDSRCIRWGNTKRKIQYPAQIIQRSINNLVTHPTDDSQCCHWNGYKNLGTKFKVHFSLRIRMIPHLLLLFNPILTFGIKLQIIAETHKLSKCKLNSLNSPEYYVVLKPKKCLSMTVKISRHKHVLFLGH